MIVTNLRWACKPSYEMSMNAELVADAHFELIHACILLYSGPLSV